MDRDRRELERLAFSKPTTRQEAAAADEALRTLLAADAAEAPESVAAPVEPEQSPDEPQLTADGPDDAPAAPARRRTLIPLIVVIGLVAGLGAGILVSRAAPALFSAPAHKSAPSPSPTPILGGTTNALAAMATPRTPADVFPVPDFATELDLEQSSIHRVLTTPDGASLWIARTQDAICMMVTAKRNSGGIDTGAGTGAGVGVAAGSTCQSLFNFSDSGLTLTFGGDTWSWNGSTFTTTITR